MVVVSVVAVLVAATVVQRSAAVRPDGIGVGVRLRISRMGLGLGSESRVEG